MKNYYLILEIDKSASKEIIEAAYKAMAKKYHPDISNGIDNRIKHEKMKNINEAREILLDNKKREKFNYELSKEEKRIKEEEIENIINSKKNKFKFKFLKLKKMKNNKKFLIILLLLILSVSQVYLVTKYFFIENILEENINTFELEVGLNKDDIILAFGKPDIENSAFLRYGESEIYLSNNLIIGWNDIYENLPFKRNYRIPTKSLELGTSKSYVLDKFGTPDVYLANGDLLTYYNMLLEFENDKLINISQIY